MLICPCFLFFSRRFPDSPGRGPGAGHHPGLARGRGRVGAAVHQRGARMGPGTGSLKNWGNPMMGHPGKFDKKTGRLRMIMG